MTKAVFLLLLVPALAFAQGQILFANNEATAITNITTAQPAITFTRVGFYINPNPSASPFTPGWVIIGYTNLNSPGIFLGGTRTLPGFPADTPVGVQIRAWLTVGSYTSFEDACVAELFLAFSVSRLSCR